MNYSAYEILGVSPTSDLAEIKRSYKKLVREYSPEHQPETFIKIRKAYEDLVEGQEIVDNFNFPFYKKNVEAIFDASTSKNQLPHTDSRKVLSNIFETPFNTVFELKELFEKNKI